MRETYKVSQSLGWKQARRAAFVQDVLTTFTQRPACLLSFEHVSQKLKLSTVHYLDLQDVRLDQIVGSVGRYTDFTRTFFPREDYLQDRWQQIEHMITSGHQLPPVELYQVGQAYFVRDGNHRVSVARQCGIGSIKAYVWEYETPVPLQADSDVDDLLCKTAHAAFLECTHVDRLCPGVEIRLTQPDGYEELLHEIEAYQQILSKIDERELSFDEAVTLWYELRYLPIVELIRQRFILAEFPGRTETDLYLWLCHNLKELETQYEHPLLLDQAADHLTKRFSKNPLSARQIKKTVTQTTGTVLNWATIRWRALRPARRHKKR